MTKKPRGAFKPMLSAKDFDINHLQYPVMVSDKFDGFRNVVVSIDGQPTAASRKLEPIPNLKVRAYFSRPELIGLDGELVVGEPTQHKQRGKIAAIWSTIDGPDQNGGAFQGSTKWHEDYGQVFFYVFDDFSQPDLGKFERYERAGLRLRDLNDPHIKLVQQKLVWNPQQLMEAFHDAVARGYEGLMVADMDGEYKYGRATASYDRAAAKEGKQILNPVLLGKIKDFADEEGEIVGFLEEMENTNEQERDALGNAKRSSAKDGKVGKGRLGAFIVRNPKYPKDFKVSTSTIPHDERPWYWENRDKLLGKMLTYKFQPSGMDEVPQFTTFVGIRED